MVSVSDDAERLIDTLSNHQRLIVAFSGGVDSSVVAAAARRSDTSSATAVTAQSPSVSQWQLQIAKRIAAEIGIQHRVVLTYEGDRNDYRRNDRHRCFYCKDTLYETLAQLADRDPTVTIVSGTNTDDLGDYRPGISAGSRRGVATPLADLGLNKRRVRELAGFFGLSNQDLPASPCLASRVAYGTEVTPERLNRIERAESYLRSLGFTQLRVRLHEEERARIEVEQDLVETLMAMNRNGQVTQKLLSFGFESVMIDPQGFRLGGLNEALATPTLVTLLPNSKTATRASATATESKEATN